MNVVSLSLCYPHDATPHAGRYVQQRLRALDPDIHVRVIHPLPTPIGSRHCTGMTFVQESPPSWHVPMPYVPAIGTPLNPWLYARAVAPLIEAWAREGQLDLLEAHFAWPDGVAAAALSRQCGIPHTITLRGVLPRFARHLLKRRSIVTALQSAAAIITVSESLRDLTLHLGIDGSKIHVVPNGVDIAVFNPGDRGDARSTLGLSDHETILISVGHLCRRKGFHHVLEVLPFLKREVPSIRYVMIGGDGAEPNLSAQLRRRARRLDLMPCVTMTGAVPPRRVADWLRAADLFVLPTRNEGCCNAIAEAIAVGLPVVCTRVGGNTEMVTPANGITIPYGDRHALENAILEALNRRKKFSVSDSARSWRDVGLEHSQVLRSAVRSPQPATRHPYSPRLSTIESG